MAKLGRPRARGESTSGLSTEEDILVAASELFSTSGYAGTSTHKIAAAAGLSQASMYHYFAGKQEILLALLMQTVRPSVDYAAAADKGDEPADTRLHALCAYDVRLLVGSPHNTGALYLLPELADAEDAAFAAFHAERKKLFHVYRRLVADVLGTSTRAAQSPASLVFGLVESVILRRRTEGDLGAAVAGQVADASLRVLGVSEERLAEVRLSFV
jgi:AcrR family transcriptional regulator